MPFDNVGEGGEPNEYHLHLTVRNDAGPGDSTLTQVMSPWTEEVWLVEIRFSRVMSPGSSMIIRIPKSVGDGDIFRAHRMGRFGPQAEIVGEIEIHFGTRI